MRTELWNSACWWSLLHVHWFSKTPKAPFRRPEDLKSLFSMSMVHNCPCIHSPLPKCPLSNCPFFHFPFVRLSIVQYCPIAQLFIKHPWETSVLLRGISATEKEALRGSVWPPPTETFTLRPSVRVCVCHKISIVLQRIDQCFNRVKIYTLIWNIYWHWWKWIRKSLDAYSYVNYSILQRIQGAVLCAIVDVQFRIGNSQKKTIRKEMQGGTLQHFSGALNLLVGPTWWISGKKMIPILQNLVPSRKIDIWLVCLFDFLN